MTPEEWAAMYNTSRWLHDGYVNRASLHFVELHPSERGER
jgi:hypothetical protein